MATTNHLGITLVDQSQSQKEVTVNAALTRLDAVLNNGVKTRSLNTPPGSPVSGDLYIVGSSPTGAWAGQAFMLTYYDQIWRFITPNEGISLWVNDENLIYSYTGAAWVVSGSLINFNTNGLLTQTAVNSFTARTLAGGGGVTVANGNGVSGNPTLGISAKRTLSIPAAQIRPSATGGCSALALVATTANHPDMSTLDFDPSTVQYAQFWMPMKKGWDLGTVSAQFLWSHASTTTNFGVVWGLQAVAVSDADSMDVAYGTAQTVTDTGGATNKLYSSAETGVITIAGTPVVGDMVCFRLYRDATNGADTLAVNARLHAIKLYYTITTLTDA